MTAPLCDPTLSNDELPPGLSHDYAYVRDEHGSLADGGSYEEYRCRVCGRIAYSPLPD